MPSLDEKRLLLKREILKQRLAEQASELPEDLAPEDELEGKQKAFREKWGEGPGAIEKIPIVGSAATVAGNAVGALGRTAADYFTKEGGGPGLAANYEILDKATDERAKEFAEAFPGRDFANSLGGGMLFPAAKGGFVAKEGAGLLARGAAGLGNAATRVGVNTGINATDAAIRGDDVAGTAETTALIGAGFEGLGLLGKGASKFVPRFMFGVKDEAVQRYRQRAAQINQTSREAVVKEVSGDISDVLAKSREAKRVVAENLDEAMEDFQKSISAKSSAAYEILNDHPSSFSTRPMKGYLSNEINQFKIGDALPQTPAIRELQGQRQFLDETSLKEMRPEDIKTLLRNLDSELDSIYEASRAGQYVPRDAGALLKYRRFLDGILKDKETGVKGYAEAMKPIADDTEAIKAARKYFGGGDRTESGLSRAVLDKSRDAREALTGFEARLKGTPQAPSPQSPGGVSKYTGSKDFLSDFERAHEPQKVLGDLSDRNAETYLNNLMGERPRVRKMDQLNYLAKSTGKDYQTMVDDLAVKEGFEKGFTRGSRNVNLGAVSLAGLAGSLAKMTGGAVDVTGAAGGAGAILGAMSDIVGPQTLKKWLDLSMTPGFQKFERLISDAASRGPRALALAVSMMEKDPEYQGYMEIE